MGSVTMGIKNLKERLLNLLKKINMLEEGLTKIEEEIEEEIENPILDRSLEDLELSVRSMNCLRKANIHRLDDLMQKTESDLRRLPNFGKGCLKDVKRALSEMGLYLKVN